MTRTTADGRSTVPAVRQDDFGDRLLVDCPACGGKAVITVEPCDSGLTFAPRRMVCHACGATRSQPRTPQGQISNPFMGLPPRLRAETRHGVLIAWNEAHLDYLEQHLAGRLRVEKPGPPVRNGSVVSRLPAWAKAAKNRDELLKAIARVRREKL